MTKLQQKPLSRTEFILLMAMMTSFVAFSIDAMLPALGIIADDLKVASDNHRQLVVSVLFFGMVFGQMICGPISDSVGRKPVIFVGMAIFSIGCLVSAFASSFEMMLVGRFLQGTGAAAPRNITIAIIRDSFKGAAMARIMSLIMSVFIFVPMIAPSIGQGLLWLVNWRGIFITLLVSAVIVQLWFATRQAETLPPEKRRLFSAKHLLNAFNEVRCNREAMGYTVCASLIFGSFVGYLTSSQQILQEQYQLGDQFALYFAIIAASIGLASFTNSTMVMRFGMHCLASTALWSFCIISGVFLAVTYSFSGQPPLWLTISMLLAAFFPIGILFGNFNAMAMASLGHVAGMASTVIGSLTTLFSVLLGSFIGSQYNQTLIPLTMGFTVLGILSLLVFVKIQRVETI